MKTAMEIPEFPTQQPEDQPGTDQSQQTADTDNIVARQHPVGEDLDISPAGDGFDHSFVGGNSNGGRSEIGNPHHLDPSASAAASEDFLATISGDPGREVTVGLMLGLLGTVAAWAVGYVIFTRIRILWRHWH